MAQHNMSNVRALLSMFEDRVLSLAAAAGRSYIIWQARGAWHGCWS